MTVNDPMLTAPHARFNCRMPGFQFIRHAHHPVTGYPHYGQPVPAATLLQDKKHCPTCFCFVCDVVASKCEQWSEHCIADDVQPHWANLRQKEREAQELEKQINKEGLPRFMRGLPKELALPKLTPAQNGYRGVVRTPQPTAAPSWPRLGGHFDFLLPRYITHTHQELPTNARIENYFALTERSVPVTHLLDADGKPQTTDTTELLKSISSLQQQGCIQIKWTIHHRGFLKCLCRDLPLECLSRIITICIDL